nr:MAG TPA: hypothetical protein [Caudoviricetes sp.]
MKCGGAEGCIQPDGQAGMVSAHSGGGCAVGGGPVLPGHAVPVPDTNIGGRG